VIQRWIDAIRNSIVAKLWLTIVSMVVIVLFVLSLFLQQFFDSFVYAQQSAELTRLATAVQHVAQTESPALARKVAASLAKAQDATIIIARPLDSDPAVERTIERMPASERARLANGQVITKQGTSPDGSGVVTAYVQFSASPAGMIAVSQRVSVLDQPIAHMRKLILFAMAVGVVLTTGLAFVISKNTSRPLIQMNKVAEAMAHGNFDGQIDVVTNDEVGQLGRTFNKLAHELAQTIAALSMEKDQLKSILTSLHDGVLAVDIQGRITLTNPPAERWLQAFSLAETNGQAAGKFPDPLRRLVLRVQETRQPASQEWEWQARHLAVTVTPLHTVDASAVRGAVIVLRDITEERRLDRLRKDFIANVSHELRTPLSMMQGYAEALLDEFGDDPVQRRELAEIIHDETLRMRRLVNDLLDLAQLESGHFQMSFDRVDVAALLRRTARKFQTIAAERQIRLQLDVPEGPCWVWADPDRMEQVFTNLLDNACRHTQPDGTVTVRAFEKGVQVRIQIQDTGTGIPPEDLPYIWERFYKADKARTRGTGGTGLGLAITRQIVLQHGGDIHVDSQLGRGTTFTIALPSLDDSALDAE
jgi:two-component system sensor histidine kinase ResE